MNGICFVPIHVFCGSGGGCLWELLFAAGGIVADFPHNCVDFPTGKPTGRFSNGENAADFLAPPITGVSFASGGAGILNETGGLLFKQAISLAQQLDYFTVVHDKLVHQLGASGAQAHLSKSLFAIVIGSNDWFAYFSVGSIVSKQYAPQQYVDRMVSTFKGLLKTKEACCGLGNLNADGPMHLTRDLLSE
ncbi:hypothetical protein L1987_19661 [Smallanthus sonchifolius]|uniref:Uncharacterized protein n=1 Tax=Smallanthus sonchifolius TaxID=185202 RepID=A0ACB9IP86_9ASTR|nr:hypothetical protein L1987_19661 [Smallanthus sonchifolius]